MRTRIHHIAVICADYEKSKAFSVGARGFTVIAEHYRKDRDSWKCDLAVNGVYQLELFSFPNPPPRLSYPEAAGLRHLAFEVADVEAERAALVAKGIAVQEIRVDEYTGKKFAFLADPDNLPIEIYQA